LRLLVSKIHAKTGKSYLILVTELKANGLTAKIGTGLSHAFSDFKAIFATPIESETGVHERLFLYH
jgi:hypothetical protein